MNWLERLLADEPRLVKREIDADCGCPEEEWDAYGLSLFMHLAAGRPSDAAADAGDEGEWQTTVTADTIDDARAAIFAWARSIWENRA